MKQGIFMRDRAADSKEAVIDIVGVIGWEVWYQALRDMLRAIPNTVERVIFDIYSPGGDVWEGNAIVQAIGALKQHTIARVQVAASMATLIAVACKERTIAGNGRWLIHNPWTAMQGDAADLEKRAKELRDCEAEAAAFYAARTGQTAEQMLALMAEERWLTPAEAKELGFVQAIDSPFDADAFAGVRAEIVAAGKWPKALAEIPVEPAPEPEPAPAEQYECECVDCGHAITTEEHCKDLKCEKCGGQMRRKERPGPGKEAANDNADTAGAAGDVPPANDGAGKPANAPDPIAEADAQGYERGLAEGRREASITHAATLGELTERAVKLTKQIADLTKASATADALQRRTQGERDSARAQVEKLNAALNEATRKIERLLAGGMSFAPSIETWADALKACDGSYEVARKRFPELYRAARDEQKASRK